VEKPYNQLKEHLESCLTKYNDLDSALGLFFLLNFCFLQVNMILSLYLSLTGLLGNRETIVEHYGSETLMGIVSISLFILALSGPVHLFNSVSWVENLQSRFHKRGQELLQGNLEESLCRVVKKVARVEHFTALKFFPISRSTLKGMAATAVTYLIILIQFKSGTPVTPS